MRRFTRSNPSTNESYKGKHRFEHWYCDNAIYFITARCRDRRLCFAKDQAKEVFWDRYTHWSCKYGFRPFITTLIDNHYHFMGYSEFSSELGRMMQRIHGSVAKLVNDLLPDRQVPFWCDRKHRDYFDGCLRSELQFRRTYKYILTQCRRHNICADPLKYPHTRIDVSLEDGLKLALEKNAFMEEVPYKRYDGED